MKKLFFTISIILFFLLIFLIFILSTIGFTTNKFNKFISDKAIESNKNISLETRNKINKILKKV